jgi:galactokinase
MTNLAIAAHEAAEQPSFASLFHRMPAAAGSAPGRVNLMGDHTDYNGGYVLSMITPQETHVELVPREDAVVRVWNGSVEKGGAWRDYRLGAEQPTRDWLTSVQAVTTALRRDGRRLSGMDIRLVSSVPPGAGLASGASLAVALLKALRNAFRLDLSEEEIAKLAYRAAIEFADAPAGRMDHMICALGRPGSALCLDTEAMTYEHLLLPPTLDWVVVHSGVARTHASESYRERRRECEAACAMLGLRSMRELEGAGRQAVLSRIDELPAPLDGRARHVVTENERVLIGAEMLEERNVQGFGLLMDASHTSLRYDYAVSVPETDLLVELAQAEEGVYGARLTGGGFGGSVVCAAEAGKAWDVAAHVVERYRRHSGRDGTILLPASPA